MNSLVKLIVSMLSPGGGINSNVNTPMGGAPDSVADRYQYSYAYIVLTAYHQKFREYMDKVKQLEKYIEPLRRMITKIGTDDQVGKLYTNYNLLISIIGCDWHVK